MTQSNRNHNYHLTLSSDGDLNFENQIHFEAENHHQNDQGGDSLMMED